MSPSRGLAYMLWPIQGLRLQFFTKILHTLVFDQRKFGVGMSRSIDIDEEPGSRSW